MPTPKPIIDDRIVANSGTLANAARISVRPVPVARPITAVPIGSPIATTEPNAISRMIIAATRPISSEEPVLGCVPNEAYSPPISASRSGERTSSSVAWSASNGSTPRSTAGSS